MYILTEHGKEISEKFIRECEIKRKEILDAGLDTADDTILPTIEDIECDINFSELDTENNDYYNGWGITDNYDSDCVLHLKYEKDFKEIERQIMKISKEERKNLENKLKSYIQYLIN